MCCLYSRNLSTQKKILSNRYRPTGKRLYTDHDGKAPQRVRQSHLQSNTLVESKAISAVNLLPVFTFGKFEEIYLENREAADSIAPAFDKYVAELKRENRIGTAVSYETAKNSIEGFRKGLKFADVSKDMLQAVTKIG